MLLDFGRQVCLWSRRERLAHLAIYILIISIKEVPGTHFSFFVCCLFLFFLFCLGRVSRFLPRLVAIVGVIFGLYWCGLRASKCAGKTPSAWATGVLVLEVGFSDLSNLPRSLFCCSIKGCISTARGDLLQSRLLESFGLPICASARFLDLCTNVLRVSSSHSELANFHTWGGVTYTGSVPAR